MSWHLARVWLSHSLVFSGCLLWTFDNPIHSPLFALSLVLLPLGVAIHGRWLSYFDSIWFYLIAAGVILAPFIAIASDNLSFIIMLTLSAISAMSLLFWRSNSLWIIPAITLVHLIASIEQSRPIVGLGLNANVVGVLCTVSVAIVLTSDRSLPLKIASVAIFGLGAMFAEARMAAILIAGLLFLRGFVDPWLWIMMAPALMFALWSWAEGWNVDLVPRHILMRMEIDTWPGFLPNPEPVWTGHPTAIMPIRLGVYFGGFAILGFVGLWIRRLTKDNWMVLGSMLALVCFYLVTDVGFPLGWLAWMVISGYRRKGLSQQ